MAHDHGHHGAHNHSAHDHGSHQHGANPDHDHMAEMLDLDVEVLHAYHKKVIGWAASLVPAGPSVVDLGAGSGTGTIALARQLPAATITAVDMDESMLEHLRGRAAAAGVAERVRTVQADLDLQWPEIGPADLVWASASMHHFGDPERVVGQVRETLKPGGVFVIAEIDSFPKFLTGTDQAALEDRLQDAMARRRDEHGMHMHEDWGARLKAAGFEVEGDRRFDIDLQPPLPAKTGRYAQVCFSRVREGLADRLSPEDVTALDTLAAGVADRDDLTVRTTRMVWIGRRI